MSAFGSLRRNQMNLWLYHHFWVTKWEFVSVQPNSVTFPIAWLLKCESGYAEAPAHPHAPPGSPAGGGRTSGAVWPSFPFGRWGDGTQRGRFCPKMLTC
jgi:hypothetical protein